VGWYGCDGDMIPDGSIALLGIRNIDNGKLNVDRKLN
jgi:hypothetical protein